jgi:hypothetical protein
MKAITVRAKGWVMVPVMFVFITGIVKSCIWIFQGISWIIERM